MCLNAFLDVPRALWSRCCCLQRRRRSTLCQLRVFYPDHGFVPPNLYPVVRLKRPRLGKVQRRPGEYSPNVAAAAAAGLAFEVGAMKAHQQSYLQNDGVPVRRGKHRSSVHHLNLIWRLMKLEAGMRREEHLGGQREPLPEWSYRMEAS